jgi:hypothetical protein
MRTLQEQYNLILEGKGDKDLFMRSARRIFPQYINQYTTFNDTTKILKSKSILTERFIGGLVTQSNKRPDWFKIFDENITEAKAIESKPTKEVVDMETRGFDYKDPKNIDNVFGPQFLTGYYAEMKDPKNSEKTVEELKTIVAKNLAKDIMYYTKDGQFGVKGLGYKESTPTKEVKGKYKAGGVEPAPKIVKESKIRTAISKIIKEELEVGYKKINLYEGVDLFDLSLKLTRDTKAYEELARRIHYVAMNDSTNIDHQLNKITDILKQYPELDQPQEELDGESIFDILLKKAGLGKQGNKIVK